MRQKLFKSFKPFNDSTLRAASGQASSTVQFRARRGITMRVLPIDSCLGRVRKPFLHFFFEGEQLLDARALLHTLEMRRDVGEA